MLCVHVDCCAVCVQLQTVNLSIGDKQLLSDAVLSLQPGVRYGLVGK